MAIPTAYTEEGLASFLFNDPGLRPIWDTIGITEDTVEDDLAEIIVDTLLAMAVDDIADISGAANIGKLRTLARYNAWLTVSGNFAIDIDYAADGESFSRSQLQDHAATMLAIWEAKAAPYLDVYTVKKQTLEQSNPYTPLPANERFTLDRYE